MTIFSLVIGLLSLTFLIYITQSLRTIGSKLSTLQTQQRKNFKEFERQVRIQQQEIKKMALMSYLPFIEQNKENWNFVVSVTSHAPRFNSLAEVLQGLKLQVLQPQSILLNIAHAEIAQLPTQVTELAATGYITIVPTDDLGPAKKLIPTLISQKELPIIVIDDDLEFDPELFLHLMVQHYLYPKAIIASRVHQVTTNSKGELNTFDQWNKQYIESDGPAADLMPTSGAGTLYPIGSLHSDAADADLYRKLSEYTDDLWWYFQGRRNGTLIRRISGFSDLHFIEDTQDGGLWKNGNQERNEANLLNLVQEYGNPLNL
jgi:hypothetical protein